MGADETFSAWLHRQLRRREWSAADLSRRTGIGTGRISEWLSGKRRPSTASCFRIAEALHVNPDDVLALAGHRIADRPIDTDDPAVRLCNMIKLVRWTPEREAGVRLTIENFLAFDRKSSSVGAPGG